MDPREGVRIAARSLAGHRLRSALTVVGIVIGIGAVIAFASFGASVQSDVLGEFQDTSASEIYVVAGGDEDGPPGPGGGLVRPAVTTHDLDELAATDGVRAVIPRGTVPVASITYANETVSQTSLTATSPATFTDDALVDGRAFESGEAELVVNEPAAASFERNISVGDTVNVTRADGESETFTVVGVTTGVRGDIGAIGGEQPEFYVPADPHYRTTVESPTVGVDQRAYPQVTVVAEAGRVTEVQGSVETYMDEDSDAARVLPAEANITVQSTADVVEGIQSVLEDVTRLVTGIGVLALIVGAVGIANIMLVSVTERTKEIGIMKSIGARNRDVMGLFLAESVILGLLGAVIGIPLGLATGYGAALYAEVGFTVPLDWVAIAVGMGIGIGVVAGLYPAWRAARVDPIEALRYE